MISAGTALRLFMLSALAAVAVACATGPAGKPPEPFKPAALSPDEQNEKAFALYNDVLDMLADAEKEDILDEMTAKYLEIIKDYPDAYFAEESYFRLMKMNMNDYPEPRFEQAEHWYREYFKTYKKPRLAPLFNDTMIRFYYVMQSWERLAAFLEPVMEKFINTGEIAGPPYILFYSDAKLNLGEVDEAMNGYNTIIVKFPETYESILSKRRLEEIRKKYHKGE